MNDGQGKALRCPKCYSLGVTPYVKGMAECKECGALFDVHEEKRDLFHRLWTIAAKLKYYEKRVWNRLREILGL